MTSYYLRVEGMNLDNFVYDTNDLSTIRGGSLLLLDAVHEVATKLEQITSDVKVVTKGASWGLVHFTAQDDRQAISITSNVRNFLKTNDYFQHATFAVDVLPYTAGQYVGDRNKLAALNHWRQMQMPSVAIPDIAASPPTVTKQKSGREHTGIIEVCEVDLVRPARKTEKVMGDEGEEELGISNSVRMRRKYGKDNRKKEWYEKQTGLTNLQAFVNDLHELAIGGQQQYGNLDRKMAVIYLDGNGFGKLQHQTCTSEAKQRNFDRKLRKEYQQQGGLKPLLQHIAGDKKQGLQADPHWFTEQNIEKKIRLETLLWGGDEICWVVPAWKGWWMLGKFFELSRTWAYEGRSLTHAAGLVFCHFNAPIHRIKNVAYQLAELAKGHSRSQNFVAYQILESFDHAGTDIEAVRKLRMPTLVNSEELFLSGDAMLGIVDPLLELKKMLPKRRLYRLVESLNNDITEADKILAGFSELGSSVQDSLRELSHCFGSGYGRSLHLLELWDYVTETSRDHNHAEN